MKQLFSVVMVIVMVMVALGAMASSAIAGAGGLCDGLDAAYINSHSPYQFQEVLEKHELKEYKMCLVITVFQGHYAPVLVPESKDAVIFGEIVKNKVPVSQAYISKLEAGKIAQYAKQLEDAVAFTYKPAVAAKSYMYMFTDPDCPYCERSKDQVARFAEENGVEVRVVLFPLPMHPDAKTKSVKGVCSKMTYKDYIDARYEGTPCPEGERKIENSLKLGRELNVNGTPTFIGASGRRASGFMPDQMKEIL